MDRLKSVRPIASEQKKRGTPQNPRGIVHQDRLAGSVPKDAAWSCNCVRRQTCRSQGRARLGLASKVSARGILRGPGVGREHHSLHACLSGHIEKPRTSVGGSIMGVATHSKPDPISTKQHITTLERSTKLNLVGEVHGPRKDLAGIGGAQRRRRQRGLAPREADDGVASIEQQLGQVPACVAEAPSNRHARHCNWHATTRRHEGSNKKGGQHSVCLNRVP
mmetsp:Transcript_144364/g.462494  ORF Transcript_144364/g.462494 Transcript_144364/m.462494 type:complete len:221 (-) Transcript_144364:3-665(-)